MRRILPLLRDGLISLTYPQDCQICGRAVQSYEDGVACRECWDDPSITRLFADEPICATCGLPLRPPVGANSPVNNSPEFAADVGTAGPRIGLFCGKCDSLPFSSARSCGTYAGAIKINLLALKSWPHLCKRLTAALLHTYREFPDRSKNDLVIPIPLHKSRLRQRGFNQAEIIGRKLASHFGLTLDSGSLKRVKPTDRHRAGMDAIDRFRSVEKAFQVVRPRIIDGASVLLIDDVYTTGSTLIAASQALLAANAARVSVLTIARVPGITRVPGNRPWDSY